MPFKFVHASDLHLDTPFRGVGADAAARRSRFQESTFRAFSASSTCACASAWPSCCSPATCPTRRIARCARGWPCGASWPAGRGGHPAFIVHGNHDPLSGDTGTLGCRVGEGVRPGLGGGGGAARRAALCRVQGISYADVEVRDDLSARFRRTATGFTRGLLHANLGGP